MSYPEPLPTSDAETLYKEAKFFYDEYERVKAERDAARREVEKAVNAVLTIFAHEVLECLADNCFDTERVRKTVNSWVQGNGLDLTEVVTVPKGGRVVSKGFEYDARGGKLVIRETCKHGETGPHYFTPITKRVRSIDSEVPPETYSSDWLKCPGPVKKDTSTTSPHISSNRGGTGT